MPKIWEKRTYIEPPTAVVATVSTTTQAVVIAPSTPSRKSIPITEDPRVIISPYLNVTDCDITYEDIMALPWPQREPAQPATLRRQSAPHVSIPKKTSFASLCRDDMRALPEPSPPLLLQWKLLYEFLGMSFIATLLFTVTAVATVYLISKSKLAMLTCVAIGHVLLTVDLSQLP